VCILAEFDTQQLLTDTRTFFFAVRRSGARQSNASTRDDGKAWMDAALSEMSAESRKQEHKEHVQFPGGEKGVDLAFVIDCTSSMAPWVTRGH
jgi:hypothetical protein